MKLRLDYFLSIGGETAIGDGYTKMGVIDFIETPSEACLLNSYDKEESDDIFITSFAPRKNTGEQPCKSHLPVIARGNNGIERSKLSNNVAWVHTDERSSNGAHFAISSWKYDLEALIKMQAEHDTKKAEPVRPVYTQAMKDAGDDIEIGMLYIDEDGHQCSLIGENNGECVYVGRPTNNKIHHRYISVSVKGSCKPIDTRTPEEKQVEEICTLLIDNGYTLDPDAIILMQTKGLLAEIK